MLKKILRNNTIREILLWTTKLLGYINVLLPHDENSILLYDGASPALRDNLEALHTYLLENGYDKKYSINLCIPNCKERRINGSPNLGVIKGVMKYMRAKYVFFLFGDMRIAPSNNQIVVNLFHGIAFKRIGKLCNDKQYQNERLDSFTYILATSKWFSPYVAAEFGIGEDRVIINGNCRCDYLLKDNYTLDCFNALKGNYKKRFIWMPTFRVSTDGRFDDSVGFTSDTGLPIFYTVANIEKLNSFCEKNNILIVVKAHNATRLDSVGNYNNIVFMTDKDIEAEHIKLYEFIKDFDALITDYSSVFIDFLLINKPICFTIDDIDNYSKGRGFIVEDPTVYMPGHIVKTDIQFFHFLNDVINGIDDYRNDRKRINDLFNENKSNQTKRLLHIIGM